MGRPKTVVLDELGRKYCSKGDHWKYPKEFYPEPKKAFGLSAYCRECQTGYQRSNYDYEKMRDIQLRQNYPGFDLAQYNAMYEAQDGVCAACGQAETIRLGRSKRSEDIVPNLAVDHCHKTNKVRALLCHPCNQAYGLLEESPERIKALLKYSQEHSS